MNVIVTGGAGYIGSHACKALKQAGYTPVVLDNLYRGNEWSIKFGPFVKVDIRETSKLTEIFLEYEPIGVMHFAGLAYVWESIEKADEYFSVNTDGTISVLEAMKAANVHNLVFSSSCITYGSHAAEFFETDLQKPDSPYGESKLKAEKEILARVDDGELRAHILRYFNVAGADPEGELGESHDPATRVVTKLLEVAGGRSDVFYINGTNYPTRDGTCVRDYIHVQDLVDAHLLALGSLIDGGQSDQFNLSLNKGFSILDVLQAVERVTGECVPYKIDEPREGDPASLVGNFDKARKILDWSPKFDLDEIIQSAWNWQQRN